VTRAVYIIGGAGTGKSTFTAEILDSAGIMGPLEDLHSKPNSRGTMITLRGHQVGEDGLYLGCMRESFPGTDGLDRVSYIPGEEWLETALLPEWIIAEGATLAARRFIRVLNETTDLVLVHLVADEFVVELRCMERGSSQDQKFITATATRSENLARDMEKEGVEVYRYDTASPEDCARAGKTVRDHLRLS
jgi:hypothetical protein